MKQSRRSAGLSWGSKSVDVIAGGSGMPAAEDWVGLLVEQPAVGAVWHVGNKLQCQFVRVQAWHP
jgi:hypothetical protein